MKHCKHKCSVTFRLCLWSVHEQKGFWRLLAKMMNRIMFILTKKPISIISSDNIFDLDNSENILKTTLMS
ncbi:unnamed protein product [Acanthoscelides obtectus]|uniref:Uncharacterized protein n=1 Tax=Acanthoscelides obtectus TaxID=200917 RepID=A0A9P0PA00_ACAOB|nr:unnamed protein product [Acanthoscelides obtectus]CAK1657221.1 hypothetical protein AOBTE_LOCUS20219 [Acanthoscelides obtectus]